MKSKFVSYAKSLRKRLVSYFYSKACEWGIHTHSKPKWEQGCETAAFATYQGRCRICTAEITTKHRFSDFNSPLYEGILPYNKRGDRDLHAIIQACITFFLED